ncbi:PilZ domain-containing protein [Alsobacter sp. SYSU M60028]|uniref:PilZ domain-containing protein n=1 Tax=Alsobacter ponti TaxID=2962936 RepID=A0ABT1L8H3_9HYPH|nr:PilZ domain-containing protein [Alsobacter ponti]MCP8937223.1 PilZ domain-containing protein [Alsobacter ponti]
MRPDRPPRQRTLKGATIVFNNAKSVLDCTVRNLSTGGALLGLPTTAGVPAAFELRIPDHPPRACRVAWRLVDRIGVAFEAA